MKSHGRKLQRQQIRHAFILACLAWLPAIAGAQLPHAPQFLVFDPVPLDSPGSPPVHHQSPLAPLVPVSTPPDLPGGTGEPALSREEIYAGISRTQARLADMENAEGAYSAELVENLAALGEMRQQAGDHEAAIDVMARAGHISRINQGLFAPQQIALIKSEIESYLAMGDMEMVNQKQAYLLYLNEKIHGATDRDMIPVLLDLAAFNMFSFRQALTLPNFIPLSISSGKGGEQITPRAMGLFNLHAASYQLERGIHTLIDNQAFSDARLLELEYKYLETLFLQAYQWDIIEDPDFYLTDKPQTQRTLFGSTGGWKLRPSWIDFPAESYRQGTETLNRILIHLRNSPQTVPLDLAAAMVELGDWHTLFERHASARESYQQAYDMLRLAGYTESDIGFLFHPALPAHLPLITAKPNSREKFGIPPEAPLEYTGHIDLRLTLNRYSRVGGIKVLDSSPAADKQVIGRLKKMLRNSPFRPRFAGGRPIPRDRVEIRYFFAYSPD